MSRNPVVQHVFHHPDYSAATDRAVNSGMWPNELTGRGVVAVDFDGVIYPSRDLYRMDSVPLQDAAKFLTWLRRRGYRIVIFTSRMSRTWARSQRGLEGERAFIEQWMREWGLPWDDVTAEKVPAEAYIDDRAIEAITDDPAAALGLAMGRLEARRSVDPVIKSLDVDRWSRRGKPQEASS